ncbi:hypothetical protein GCWU000324_02919 [Kingella oralis ATCC 51147]|uniref:Uncharacterized protein n=1 Tax=Kingella oralis ATCC 51147 TaxID=629741 RepID=C4GMI4_9NEIS|nr:hypothetical protein GCWU000324_02919 [Kingella oralis ATCC 51147]
MQGNGQFVGLRVVFVQPAFQFDAAKAQQPVFGCAEGGDGQVLRGGKHVFQCGIDVPAFFEFGGDGMGTPFRLGLSDWVSGCLNGLRQPENEKRGFQAALGGMRQPENGVVGFRFATPLRSAGCLLLRRLPCQKPAQGKGFEIIGGEQG